MLLGFREGLAQLGKEGLQFGKENHRLQQVLLFSDGQPNSESGLREMIENGIQAYSDSVSISTLGFGSDHNPVLLQDISRIGNGNYEYIPAHDDTVLKAAFAKFLLSTDAKTSNAVKVKVSLASGVRVDGLSLPGAILEESGELVFDLPAMQKGQPLHIVLPLNVMASARSLQPRAKRALLRANMEYQSLVTRSPYKADETLYVTHSNAPANEVPLLVEEQLLRKEAVMQLRAANLACTGGGNDNTNTCHDVVSVKTALGVAIDQLRASIRSRPSIHTPHRLRDCILGDLNALQESVYNGAEDASIEVRASLESHEKERGGKFNCYLSSAQEMAMERYCGEQL